MQTERPRYSPLIYGYLKKYQEDPTSRVFAPLAEAYRKAGLIEEAIEIAREGLRIHPAFVGGRVALARALFDQAKYADVVDELSSVVRDVPDNLVAQRLVAEASLMLGRVADALGAYKMLLYFSPGDTETAKIVQELEAQAYEQGALVLRSDTQLGEPGGLGDFEMRAAGSAIGASPEMRRMRWMRKVEILQGLLQKIERYRTHHGGQDLPGT